MGGGFFVGVRAKYFLRDPNIYKYTEQLLYMFFLNHLYLEKENLVSTFLNPFPHSNDLPKDEFYCFSTNGDWQK